MTIKKAIFTTLKRITLAIVCLLAVLVALPFVFPHTVDRKINQWINANINGNMSFTGTRVTFFKHFPSLTLVLDNVTLNGPHPFEQDTLIIAKSIGLGIDLSSVLQRKITINKIFLYKARINIQVDSTGAANYSVYKKSAQDTTVSTDSSGASLGIKKILIEESDLVYNDRSIPMTINAHGLNYTGTGDLSKDIFDLATHAEISSFDFYFNKQPYVLGKKINADLVTEINTRSLAFVFKKNDLMINQLPMEFNGRFAFLKNGYDMDFHINSHENDIQVIISALPAEYQKMLEKTTISGTGNIGVALTGKYIAQDTTMPDLSMQVRVSNGSVNNDRSPFPVKNLHLDVKALMPHLNADSISVNIDTLHFNVADGFCDAVLRAKGIQEPDIYAKVNAQIDLEKWHKAMGLKPYSFKGWLALDLLAEGKYAKAIVHTGLRKWDTVITSIPKFKLNAVLKDGYFKYTALPVAMQHIGFELQADCADDNYKHINVALSHLNAEANDNYVRGYCKVGNTTDFPIDAMLQARVHLNELRQFYPIDGLDVRGDLDAAITAKGNYRPDLKRYPVIAASVTVKDGYVKTKYFPDPVSDIQCAVSVSDSSESLKGLNVNVQPLTFNFEGEPFLLKAKLKDFTDLDYKVKIKGNLDVGKIYKVFARKGYAVSGIVGANLSLWGRQSDAAAGNYDALSNRGSITVHDLSFSTDIYPNPFLITHGVFRFDKEKVWFDTFAMKYANSTIVLNGAATNVVDYFIKPGSVLKGVFNLQSDGIVVDDFMSALPDTTHSAATSNSSGVVMVPENLDLDFTADVKQVKYSDMIIRDAKGHLMMRNDSIIMQETGFTLIDAPIEMDAVYTVMNPQKACFGYHISAQDFDVHKAYTNIKLFHDLASSAAHAEGLVSIDYDLSGNLCSGMAPVYPSLKGGGVISAQKIKMHGFKLLNAIGKETGKDEVGGDPDVSEVNIKSTIANNIITIARTKVKLAVFHAQFEGQVSFDKAMDLKFRLGLPPGGLIGIPMTITGTEDDPKIRLGKGREGDTLQEVPDKGN